MRGVSLFALLGVLCLPGCRFIRSLGEPRGKPPIEVAKAAEWKNFKGVVFHPPDAAMHAWRAMTLQEWPRPKKGPEWKSLAVEVGGELQMPPDCAWRCLVNPVDFRTLVGEIPKQPDGWNLVRTMRCSNDGWRTYSQAAFSVVYGQDGTPGERSGRQAELYLHDVINGKGTDITMILRPD